MTPDEFLRRIDSARARLEGADLPLPPASPAGPSVVFGERPGEPAPLAGKTRYTLPEICRFEGAALVETVFTCLAGRPASPDELLTYGSMLARGDTKTWVIGEILRRSGARRLSAVRGLRARYLVQRIYRLPVIGAAASWVGSVLRLPAALRYQRMTEQQLRSEIAAIRESVANRVADAVKLEARIDSRAAARHAELQTAVAAIGERVANLALPLASTEQQLRAAEERLAELQPRVDAVAAAFEQRVGRRPDAETLETRSPDHLGDARATSQALGFAVAHYDRDDARYHLFEAAFYNTHFVLQKQRVYLKYIDRALAQHHRFLDLGCGRGEFLANLREAGIPAFGIDLSPVNVDRLVANGFEALRGDGIAYLRQQQAPLSGIAALQVIEHLPRGELEALVDLAFERLAAGGTLILETVNPHAPFAMGNFYMDETHVAPIPPERLAFLMQFAGFEDVRVLYSTPVPGFAIAGPEPRSHYNDFAVIGLKPGDAAGDRP